MRVFQKVSILVWLLGMLISTAAASEPVGVRFGIDSFLGNLYHSEIRGPVCKTTPQDRTNYLDAVQALGITTMRETFMNWAEIQPKRGDAYQFSAFDDIAKKASDRGIQIIGLAYPFPCWATGAKATPPDQQSTRMKNLPLRRYKTEFDHFVRATVTRYCGQKPESLPLKLPIREWIFSNELDGRAAPDEYAFWLKNFYEQVKAVDPGAKVAICGLGAPEKGKFLRQLLESPNLQGPAYPYFDVVPCHTALS